MINLCYNHNLLVLRNLLVSLVLGSLKTLQTRLNNILNVCLFIIRPYLSRTVYLFLTKCDGTYFRKISGVCPSSLFQKRASLFNYKFIKGASPGIGMYTRDVNMGKILLRPLRWWAESAPPSHRSPLCILTSLHYLKNKVGVVDSANTQGPGSARGL